MELSDEVIEQMLEEIREELKDKGVKVPDSFNNRSIYKAQIKDSYTQKKVILPTLSIEEFRTLSHTNDMKMVRSQMRVSDSTNLNKIANVALKLNKLNILNDSFYKESLSDLHYSIVGTKESLSNTPIVNLSKLSDSEGTIKLQVLDTRFGTLDKSETVFIAPYHYNVRRIS